MANILTPQAQKRVWSMYRGRLVLVTALMLLALALLALLALAPSYVALTLAAPPVQNTDIKHQSGTDKDAAVVARAQALVREVGGIIAATSSPSTWISDVVQAKPQGVRITSITYGSSQITIAGSGSRESVQAYREALLKTGAYTSVSVPVSALVGNEGGKFSIVIAGGFK